MIWLIQNYLKWTNTQSYFDHLLLLEPFSYSYCLLYFISYSYLCLISWSSLCLLSWSSLYLLSKFLICLCSRSWLLAQRPFNFEGWGRGYGWGWGCNLGLRSRLRLKLRLGHIFVWSALGSEEVWPWLLRLKHEGLLRLRNELLALVLLMMRILLRSIELAGVLLKSIELVGISSEELLPWLNLLTFIVFFILVGFKITCGVKLLPVQEGLCSIVVRTPIVDPVPDQGADGVMSVLQFRQLTGNFAPDNTHLWHRVGVIPMTEKQQSMYCRYLQMTHLTIFQSTPDGCDWLQII